MTMCIATALHLNVTRSSLTAPYSGINPDTAEKGPLAKLGGKLAQMVEAVGLPMMEVEDWGITPGLFLIFLEVVHFILFVGVITLRLREVLC